MWIGYYYFNRLEARWELITVIIGDSTRTYLEKVEAEVKLECGIRNWKRVEADSLYAFRPIEALD